LQRKKTSETAIDFETSSSLSTLADSNIVEGQIVEVKLVLLDGQVEKVMVTEEWF
jgi:hypothetical protein